MSASTIKRRFCDNAPLSVQQKNIWMEHELYPDNISYNMGSYLRLSGDLNIEAFKKSLSAIVQRHEIFRTTFTVRESEPRQIIHPHIEVSVSETVLTMFPPQEQETEIKRTIHRESRLPFDLERGPLFRFTLLTLDKNEYVFLMIIHHLVMDGWSTGLFANELSALYEAFCYDRPPPLPKVDIQYSDYAVWQNDKYKESQEKTAKYWTDVTKDAVFGEFPPDYPRVFGKKGESATLTTTIPADLNEKIKSFSLQVRSTPFITLMAGFLTVLNKYTDQENLLSGCYTAGRDQSELRKLPGQYSNLTMIRTDFSGDPDFREIVKRTRRSFFDTFQNGHLLVSNLSGYQGGENSLNSTLFPVVFNFQNYPYPGWKLCNLDIKPEPIATGTARFNIEISITPIGEDLEITVQYRKDLYSENTIDRILGHYRNIISSAIESPDQQIHKLPMMSPSEIRQIVEDWNSEKAVYPTDATIHQLIDATAKENPDAIALTYNGQDVSYQKLINLSNHIASHLTEMGVGPEVKVGVYMERSHNLIITLLAILKAGGVYVPLDPIYPDEKLAFMLKDSIAPILLTDGSIESPEASTGCRVPGEPDRIPAFPANPEDFAITSKFPYYEGKIITVDSLLSQYSEEKAHTLPTVSISSENSAYLIHTSGSAGKPKGVLVSHRNVVNCFCFMNEYIDVGNSSRTWLFSTSISFDPSVLEMFWTLSHGYRVVVLPNESSGKFLDIDAIPELIRNHHVSHFQGTPSALSMLVDRADGLAALKQLSKLMVGGERLPFALAKKLSAELEIDIYNVYGPTEATIWATYYSIRKNDTCVPIGRPFPNYKIYILDRNLQPVPIGAYGELYIGGDGVACGYFNDQELTERKYLSDPFSNRPYDRVYRTGDMARYRADGIIEFHGRSDRQVKARGHRIELGEIEAAIMDCGKVREAIVITSGNTDIDRKILGYVIPELSIDSADEQDSYIKNLKEILGRKLPEFMIPSRILTLKEFPKLSNGKIDRKSLPLPEMPERDAAGLKSVLSSTESAIMEIWEDVLGFGGFNINDNYMEIGGNSLSAIIISNRIKSILKVKIAIRDFLDNPTIKLLAKLVKQRIESSASELSETIVSVDRNDDMPLSSFQESRLRYELSMDVGNVSYLNVSTWFSIRLSGRLDREALEKAFDYIINRHEVFRTAFWPTLDSFSPVTNKWNTVCRTCCINPGLFLPKVKFKQFVQPNVTMNLGYYDVSKYDDGDKNVEIRIIADEIIEKRYKYESPPLTRAALIRTAEAEHIFIVAASHLIADAFSMNIYEKELAYAYNAIVNKQSMSLPGIETRYADYSAWQKRRLETGALDSVTTYWQRQFDGYVPTDVTILPFTDIEGSENDEDFDIEAKYLYHPISDELGVAIRKYAGSNKITVFSIAMTGFILCLHVESGKDDIGVFTFFANRALQETENIIGMFATGNIVRLKIDKTSSFHQCILNVSESLNGALKNQELMISPSGMRAAKSFFDYVVSRPITCELLMDDKCASFSGLDAEKTIFGRSKSEYALRSFVIDSLERLSLLFQYNLDLFDAADIKQMAARTESIIKEMITNPLKTISSLE